MGGHEKTKAALLAEFLRMRLCVFLVCLSMAGYLLFNPFSAGIVPVILASFFLFAGTYAYNNTTDTKEDLINRKRVNPFSQNNAGRLIVLLCFSLGLAISLALPPSSMAAAAIFLALGISYSFFRVKRFLLVKNIYTGTGLSLLFVLGAGAFNAEILWYYIIIAVFFFAGSLVSDLRDYEGDKRTGIGTFPVRVGYDKAKTLICVLLVALSAGTLATTYRIFPLTLASVMMIFFVAKTKPHIAHGIAGFSLIAFAGWVFFMRYM